METDVDRQIARAADLLARVNARRIGKRARSAGRRAKRAVRYMVVSLTAIMVVTLGWAILSPIGLQGILVAMLAMIVAIVGSVLFSRERSVPATGLPRLDLPALPRATEIWLEDQRRSLPTPALPMIDRIEQRLEELAPLLQRLNPEEPTAREAHMLLSDHLPKLVGGYQSIPRALRSLERNGRIADRELVEGLVTIESEMAQMAEQLARTDLDSLAAHGRYLEMKYRD